MPSTIVFYISGHGFGHASRDVEIINAIQTRRPEARIVVRSAVPRHLFACTVGGAVDLQPVEADTGMAQIDSLQIDEDESARQAARFYRTFDRRIDEEAAHLRALQATVLVSDVPPLACAAARRAGLPSIVVANFTWDWIYRAYPQFDRLAPGVIDAIGGAYATATVALRLPLHGGFETMGVIRDIPLIARTSRWSRMEARERLGLSSDRPIVLVSFGGHGVRLSFDSIVRAGDLTLIVTDHELATDEAGDSSGRLRRFTADDLAARGLRYEDLVAASDVVVSKPGYGIVSECIANRTALLYASRGRFPEYDVFVADMPAVLRCRHLSREDLLAGRWSAAVHALLDQPPPPNAISVNGADICAGVILDQ